MHGNIGCSAHTNIPCNIPAHYSAGLPYNVQRKNRLQSYKVFCNICHDMPCNMPCSMPCNMPCNTHRNKLCSYKHEWPHSSQHTPLCESQHTSVCVSHSMYLSLFVWQNMLQRTLRNMCCNKYYSIYGHIHDKGTCAGQVWSRSASTDTTDLRLSRPYGLLTETDHC